MLTLFQALDCYQSRVDIARLHDQVVDRLCDKLYDAENVPCPGSCLITMLQDC